MLKPYFDQKARELCEKLGLRGGIDWETGILVEALLDVAREVREADAKIAEASGQRAFDVYKGRSPVSDNEPFRRADAYSEGWGDGAYEIGRMIRAGMELHA